MKVWLVRCLCLCLLSACAAIEAGDTESLVLPTGARYQGEMQDGRLHGDGQLSWPNGDRYRGEFRRGRMSGQGELTLENGEVYRGRFVDGLMQGAGEWQDPDSEAHYLGQFKDDLFHGEGVYTDEGGGVFTGDFVEGDFTGLGTYRGPENASYAGEFSAWRYQGYGVWEDDERRYTGEFSDGYFHGFGETLNKESGSIAQSGQWRWGRFVGDKHSAKEKRERQLAIENAVFDQHSRLQKALGNLSASAPDQVDMYALVAAGDGTQKVFNLETQTIAETLLENGVSPGHLLRLSNHPSAMERTALLTLHNLQAAFAALAERVQKEDIIFVYLTSHGSEQHELSLEAPGHDFVDITPEALAELLEPLQDNPKVLMISACYSGGFIDSLKAPSHLVMTAARADRTSFGCGDSDTMTYFGRAYFKKALPGANGFVDAFEKARSHIEAWEDEGDIEHSQPQLHKGKTVEQSLRRWWTLN